MFLLLWKENGIIFGLHRDYRRLLISLIINEQHVIQKPVICHPFYIKKEYFILSFFHFKIGSILVLYCFQPVMVHYIGASVNGFKDVNKRIDLGKRIADILFNEQLVSIVL